MLAQYGETLEAGRHQLTSIIVVDPQRRSAQEQRIEWPTDLNEERAYPDALPAIRSLMTWEEADFGKTRRCLVEMTTPLSADRVLEFEDWIRPWYRLVEEAAYAVPIGLPEEVECIAGTVNQFDDHVIEVGMARLLASEKAWNALANITLTLWGPSGVRRILVD